LILLTFDMSALALRWSTSDQTNPSLSFHLSSSFIMCHIHTPSISHIRLTNTCFNTPSNRIFFKYTRTHLCNTHTPAQMLGAMLIWLWDTCTQTPQTQTFSLVMANTWHVTPLCAHGRPFKHLHSTWIGDLCLLVWENYIQFRLGEDYTIVSYNTH